MGKYTKDNQRAIKRGLDWLTKVKDEVIERGMLKLLPDAMAYALSIHDETHFGHRITEDSHGWALVKDGRIVKIEVNEGHHGKGDAHKQLQNVAQSITTPGYVGIVLSSLNANREDGRPIIFEIEYELGVLFFTADEIADHFSQYFKRIS